MSFGIRLGVLLFPALLFAESSQIVGEWSGSAKMVFHENGSGYVSTGLCEFEIKWSATQD